MPSPSAYLLPYAHLEWRDDRTPFALDYDDLYWSGRGGLEEKQYIFVDGCRLQERWQKMPAGSHFSIAELGLGFALNLLLTLRCWNNTENTNCTIDYVACELHLVPIEGIGRIAKSFGLESEFALLQNKYPNPIPGNHTLWLTPSFCLHVVVGDAMTQSEPLDAHFDAVFLDGFSPSKNEDIWHQTLIRAFAKRLRPGGIATTYSVAGRIRRCLSDAGLIVEKPPGFGTKRDMLLARAPGTWAPHTIKKQRVAIVGAGLTGLMSAQAISRYGHEVIVIDSQPRYGAVKDINQIAIYPQLSQTPQPYSNLYLRSFSYFARHQHFHQTGRLELLDSPERIHKAKMLAAQLEGLVTLLSPSECSEVLGFSVLEPGLYTPEAGWIEPQQICPSQDVIEDHVHTIANRANGWELELGQTKMDVDAVVLATGPLNMPALEPLKLMALRGQSLRLTEPKVSPNCVMSSQKTWFPSFSANGAKATSTVSGTYSRFDIDSLARSQDTQLLLNAVSPYTGVNPQHASQVGIRSATRDRLPVTDQLPNWQALETHLGHPKTNGTPFTDYQDGLYCSVGFGSHAGTLGPYCAELLARKINQLPIPEDMSQISSTRFAIRDAAKIQT